MRPKIGDLLMEAGLVSKEQIENAMRVQHGKHKKIGKILIELGYVDEMQVTKALSKLLSIPFVDCDKFVVTKQLLATIPQDMAEDKMLFPLELKEKKLLLAMVDPLDWQTIDEISFRTGFVVTVAVALESVILDLLEKYYGSSTKMLDFIRDIPGYEGVEFIKDVNEEKSDKLLGSSCDSSDAPPIIKLVTMIITDAVKSRASDVHIEPMEKDVQVRYRIDGELKNMMRYPKHIQNAVVSRIKIISNMDITNRRLPQDGRSTIKLKSRSIDLRISTLPSVYGEKVVIRLLDSASGLIPFGKLGLQERVFERLLDLIGQPHGMLLVTGPTGSGKTSTLYSILQQLQTETENIITIEDPVEYKLTGITQVGMNEAIGLTFASTLRSVLRQDPDIIMVGEIRDLETADIATKAALTGHLVLTTLHTNDTISSITRLLDIGVEPFLVASAISGIIAQRLVRSICPQCKVTTSPPEELLKNEFPPLDVYYKGLGCKECNYTGYHGRVGVYEFLQLNKKMKRLIAHNAQEDEMWECARDSGMVSFFDDAWAKVAAGLTTVEEVISKVPFRHIDAKVMGSMENHESKIAVCSVLGVSDVEFELIRTTLEPAGYQIVHLTGDDILETFKKIVPDLIISALSAELFSFLGELRQDIRSLYLPVLALADLTEKINEEEGFKRGINDFIYRPLTQKKLLHKIDHVLNGN